jgi:acetylornithine deacetylase
MSTVTDRVLATVEDDELVDVTAQLVRIPSTGGSAGEDRAQQWFAERMTEAGLDLDHWPIDLATTVADPDFPGQEVDRTVATGLVGLLPGAAGSSTKASGTSNGARRVMFNGHIDVVPPGDVGAWTADPFSGHVRDGRIYGRGSCDMKAGLVAALFAIRAIRRAGIELAADVTLASVVGEEDGGLGTFALLRRGHRADVCVIPEPTGLDVISACGGALTFRLVINGLAVHASRRGRGVSAIERFVPVFAALRQFEADRNRDVDPLMRRWDIAYPLEIGMLHAGDWASSVPDRLVAEGRLGVALDETPAAARAALEATVQAVCADDPWLAEHPVQVEWWGGQFDSGRLPAGSDLVDRVSAAHHAVVGTMPVNEGAPYGTDLRLMTRLGGVPTLHYGPGHADQAHGPDEFVPVDEVLVTARVLALLLLDLARPSV